MVGLGIGPGYGRRNFSPRQIAGIVALYDASRLATLYQDDAKTTLVTASAQTVGAWVDPISGRDLLQASSGRRPQYNSTALNGGPCLFGDATDDRMVTSTFSTLSQPQTYIFCLKLNSTLARTFMDGDDTGAAKLLINTTYRLNAGTAADSLVTADTSTHVLMVKFNGASSTFQLDGNAPVTGLNTGAGTTTDTILWDTKTSGSPSSARIGLLAVVNGSVDSNTYNLVRDYCRARWGNP